MDGTQRMKDLVGPGDLDFILWTMMDHLDFVQRSDIKHLYFQNID